MRSDLALTFEMIIWEGNETQTHNYITRRNVKPDGFKKSGNVGNEGVPGTVGEA